MSAYYGGCAHDGSEHRINCPHCGQLIELVMYPTVSTTTITMRYDRWCSTNPYSIFSPSRETQLFPHFSGPHRRGGPTVRSRNYRQRARWCENLKGIPLFRRVEPLSFEETSVPDVPFATIQFPMRGVNRRRHHKPYWSR